MTGMMRAATGLLLLATAMSAVGFAQTPGPGETTSVEVEPSPSQPCATSSAQEFCVVLMGAQMTGPDPVTALTEAIEALESSLVDRSGVTCGPCLTPGACTASITNLDGAIQIMGPSQQPDGSWIARCWYEGCFRIGCSACE